MSESPLGISIDSRLSEYVGPVSEGYQRLNRALDSYFNEHLYPTDIRKIRVRYSPRGLMGLPILRDPPNRLGRWDQDSKTINLFTRIHEVSGVHIEDTLFHEGGHAFMNRKLGSIVGAFLLDAPYTAQEGLAEWVKIIAKNNGDRKKVAYLMGRWVQTDPEHKLFSSLIKQHYPGSEDKIKDAAIIDFVFRKYGIQAVSEIVRVLSRWITIRDYVGIDSLFSGIVRKKYQDFDNSVQAITGKSLEQLTQEAYNFYSTEPTQSSPSPELNFKVKIFLS